MNKAKKQHFVSQFILRNFCIDDKGHLWIFDKLDEKEYKASIRDSACEKYFYEYSEGDNNTNIELKLSKLESDCYSIIQKIIADKSIKNVTKIEHGMICLFSAVQFLRTNKSRELIKQTNKGIIEKLKKKGSVDGDFEKNNILTEEQIRDLSLEKLNGSAGNLAPYFLEKEFALVEVSSDEYFYISDNPIALYNHSPRPLRGNLGLRLKGIEIQFPITSKLCLVFMCPETVAEVRRGIEKYYSYKRNGIECPVDMKVAEDYLKSFDDGLCGKLTKENVEYHNSLQVINSSRYIYSCTNNFDLVRDMVRLDPELKNPKRIAFY